MLSLWCELGPHRPPQGPSTQGNTRSLPDLRPHMQNMVIQRMQPLVLDLKNIPPPQAAALRPAQTTITRSSCRFIHFGCLWWSTCLDLLHTEPPRHAEHLRGSPCSTSSFSCPWTLDMATFMPCGVAATASNTRISITWLRWGGQLPRTRQQMALWGWSKLLEVPHSHYILLQSESRAAVFKPPPCQGLFKAED